MDPLSALRATYHIVLFGIELDQVPQEVRNSLELVRTCHADLQYLIEIRNELLPLLQRRPKVLERVNSIVETTHKGLVEVCEIVEKSRPRLNPGRSPFRSRLSWILLDSAQFKAQRPVISRHHASVLAELNFLRQIALLAPSPERGNGDDDVAKKPTMLFDNVALLEDLIGKANTSGTIPLCKPSIYVDVGLGSVTSLPAYPSDINPPEQRQPVDAIASQTFFAVPSGPSTVYSALSPPSVNTDCPKLPPDFLFSSLSKIDIPEHLLDQKQDAPSVLEHEEPGGEVLDSLRGVFLVVFAWNARVLQFGDHIGGSIYLKNISGKPSPDATTVGIPQPTSIRGVQPSKRQQCGCFKHDPGRNITTKHIIFIFNFHTCPIFVASVSRVVVAVVFTVRSTQTQGFPPVQHSRYIPIVRYSKGLRGCISWVRSSGY
ncbi:hypothetical protein CFIO01_01782 [Colletotrichum fioriniae PJ7]|uniref:Uncharacterized protein n=1 Tax=Colletotrichum fioriniae PJ7 TaxID=1445577 RepID=A0A010QKA1_9PEZI|nr:hypothetical protein CFIO01_01782 [Colletotrichum fioriniae PJ7]